MSYIKKLMVTSAAGLGGALALAVPVSALVHTNDIADGAVTTAKIANGAVSHSRLGADAVRTGNIVNGGVTSADIKNGTINGNDISAAAAINLTTGSVTLGNNGPSATDGTVTVDNTRATGATGSFQSLAGDVTYNGAAGGTSTYHAGVMGNFHGDTLTNTNASIHAGTIGSYNVTTSDGNTGPKAGLVGEVGDLSVAESGVMSVLGGDSAGSWTPNAAYGVAYMNSTAGHKFNYGLDLKHAAIGSYQAVTYGVADIRLANGTTIASGASNPSSACVVGSLFMNTGDGKLYICTATTPTWTVVGSQS